MECLQNLLLKTVQGKFPNFLHKGRGFVLRVFVDSFYCKTHLELQSNGDKRPDISVTKAVTSQYISSINHKLK